MSETLSAEELTQVAREINALRPELNRLQNWYAENRRERGIKPGEPDPLFPKLGEDE